MPDIQWSDELAVGLEDIDHDHQDTINRLHDLSHAVDDAAFTQKFIDFAAHLREHFGSEQALMEESGFFALVPHTGEHVRVLGIIDTMLKQIDSGDLSGVRHYIDVEFPEWFLAHRASMDQITASHIKSWRDD